MDYRQVISDSWKYTQTHKKLIIWFGFVPSIFTTTVGVGYILYQIFAFKKSFLFSEDEHGFLGEVISFILNFFRAHTSWTVPLIVLGIIFAVIYFLLPTLTKAASIQTIARNKNGQPAGVGTGIRHGIMSYLPMFEYHLLIKTFAFFSILFEMSFVLRNLGMGIFLSLLPIFIIFSIIGFALTLLFTYADFFIVIDGNSVFESMRKSARLVIMHWKQTFLIFTLMILIGVRIIIQVILVFLIPTLILLITGYLAVANLPITGLVVGGSVGFVALLMAAYLNGIVDVFSYTVWTFTFLEITSEKELSAREIFTDKAPKLHPEPEHKNL